MVSSQTLQHTIDMITLVSRNYPDLKGAAVSVTLPNSSNHSSIDGKLKQDRNTMLLTDPAPIATVLYLRTDVANICMPRARSCSVKRYPVPGVHDDISQIRAVLSAAFQSHDVLSVIEPLLTRARPPGRKLFKRVEREASVDDHCCSLNSPRQMLQCFDLRAVGFDRLRPKSRSWSRSELDCARTEHDRTEQRPSTSIHVVICADLLALDLYFAQGYRYLAQGRQSTSCPRQRNVDKQLNLH
nr:hypothetical protein CFP56_04213 [Quercus suber]